MKKDSILKSTHKNQCFFYLLFLFLLQVLKAYPVHENLTPPPGKKPLEVTVELFINKIYNINTVDETYQIDGYLSYTWMDERMKFIDGDTLTETMIFENDRAIDLLDTKLWVASLEMINVQGSIERPNITIKISPDGKIEYDERFFGVFSSNMNFKNFPFDSQNFNIQIEPFTYDSRYLVFTNPKLYPEETNDSIINTWKIIDMSSRIVEHAYPEDYSETYSRAVFEVIAKRMTGYYLWQVLFPLFIIIMASFVIFWIRDFGTQIGIGFTLMLTVVAFNFYSTTILPKLPYQTFIEAVIIVGYIFIFLGIIAVIVNYRIFGNKKRTDSNQLLQTLRYIFPFGFFVTMIIMYFVFRIGNF